MPGPAGGRAHAQYGDEHLQVIRRYQRLKVLGFPPAAIKQLMSASVGVPFPISPGITLVVDPEQIGVRRDLDRLRSAFERLLSNLFEGDNA
jgi:DNA-binding transcriptional MerR regulator